MEPHLPYRRPYSDVTLPFPRMRGEAAETSEEEEAAARAWIEREAQVIYGSRLLQSRLAGILAAAFVCSWNRVGMVLFPALTLLMLAVDRRLVGQQNAAGRRLAQSDHARVVGSLIDMMTEFERSAVIEEALIHLLPRLRASEARLLNPHRRKHLIELLKQNPSNPTFQTAILRALEQIGDEQAVPVVERLARAARWGAVRRAAQECLPFLYAHAEQERLRCRLLRPALPPEISAENLVRSADSATDDLLRPLHSAAVSEPHTLLRSHPPQE